MGGIVSGIMDTVTQLTGGSTKAEKAAKASQEAQQASLLAIQADQNKAVQERQKRMSNAQAGRASLLSGSELGVTNQQPLSKTLG